MDKKCTRKSLFFPRRLFIFLSILFQLLVLSFSFPVKLNGNRLITGTLRGYDPFMNLVIDEAAEHVKSGNVMNPIGMVVVRGNSVIMIEALERV